MRRWPISASRCSRALRRHQGAGSHGHETGEAAPARAEGGWRLARATARLRGVRGAWWPSSSCSFPARVFFSPTTAVQHPLVPIVSRVPSPGLLLGAASPGRLTTRQGTRVGVSVKAAALGGGGPQRGTRSGSGGLGLDGAPPRARVVGSLPGAAASRAQYAAPERAGAVPREAVRRLGVWGSAPAAAPVVLCVRGV